MGYRVKCSVPLLHTANFSYCTWSPEYFVHIDYFYFVYSTQTAYYFYLFILEMHRFLLRYRLFSVKFGDTDSED